MSQLIHMRQRIKAVSTIKKITSAMRLISRSFHTRLYRESHDLNEYDATLYRISQTLYKRITPPEPSSAVAPTTHSLVILVGSQKGLCGSYNATITHWIDRHQAMLAAPDCKVIVISKKIEEYLLKKGITPDKSFAELKISSFSDYTNQLLKLVTDKKQGYAKVSIVANKPKNFFSHEYKEIQLIPFLNSQETSKKESRQSCDYTWTHDQEMVFNTLVHMQLLTTLRSVLFSSFLGEQSARFIAMDNATRNANKFLDTMKLRFNKLRQEKITKELTELAGAFDSKF